MTTFHDLRIALLDSYMDGEIDDDEFLVLWQVYQSKNYDFPYEDYGQFSLDKMDETECRADFDSRRQTSHFLSTPWGFQTSLPVLSEQYATEWRACAWY